MGPAGTEKDLKRAGGLLAGRGATRDCRADQAGSGARSNVAGSARAPGAEHGTVGELVATYLADQCDVLASNNIRLPHRPPKLHKTGVAARRLRSTLRIFGDIVDANPAAKLNDEFIVARRRTWQNPRASSEKPPTPQADRSIAAGAGSTKAELLREAEITKTLATERDDGGQGEGNVRPKPTPHAAVGVAGRQHHFHRSRRPEVEEPRRDKMWKRPSARPNQRLRKADDDIDQLHRARKAFKRARYALELVEPADSQMKAIARDSEEMQTLLGKHAGSPYLRRQLPRHRGVRRGGRDWGWQRIYLRRLDGQRAASRSGDP